MKNPGSAPAKGCISYQGNGSFYHVNYDSWWDLTLLIISCDRQGPEIAKRAKRVEHSASKIKLTAVHQRIKIRTFSFQVLFDKTVHLFRL